MPMSARNRRRRRKEKRRLGELRAQTRMLIVQRMNSADAPIIDHAFTLLHVELAQWPDGWRVDPHGTGNNPHEWFPAYRTYGMTPCKQTDLHAVLDCACPCGLYQTVWNQSVEIAYAIRGLIERSVQ